MLNCTIETKKDSAGVEITKVTIVCEVKASILTLTQALHEIEEFTKQNQVEIKIP